MQHVHCEMHATYMCMSRQVAGTYMLHVHVQAGCRYVHATCARPGRLQVRTCYMCTSRQVAGIRACYMCTSRQVAGTYVYMLHATCACPGRLQVHTCYMCTSRPSPGAYLGGRGGHSPSPRDRNSSLLISISPPNPGYATPLYSHSTWSGFFSKLSANAGLTCNSVYVAD